MRAVKRSSLAFGLVNIPVRLYKATETHDIGFHQYHGGPSGCLGGIGQKRVCKSCLADVDYGDIVKGIEHNDKLVFITPDELKSLDDEQGSQIDVLQFVQQDEIDPILWEQPYFVEPDGSAEGYALLRRVLAESDRVAVVRFALRTKTHLGILRVFGNVLTIHTMMWGDEVRNAGELNIPDVAIPLKPQAVKMAHQLVESMLGVFNPDEYRDSYTERLGDLIEAKAADAEFVTTPHQLDADEDEVSDLMAQLEASIKRHPAGKGKAKAKKRGVA